MAFRLRDFILALIQPHVVPYIIIPFSPVWLLGAGCFLYIVFELAIPSPQNCQRPSFEFASQTTSIRSAYGMAAHELFLFFLPFRSSVRTVFTVLRSLICWAVGTNCNTESYLFVSLGFWKCGSCHYFDESIREQCIGLVNLHT